MVVRPKPFVREFGEKDAIRMHRLAKHRVQFGSDYELRSCLAVGS